VLVWPVKVQGEGAADEVAAAIRGFNAMPRRPDVIIVARGGGSIEDLMAFNEEIVVRAAAASEIPLISAVGHETDTTLIDFASDRRAPTPTAAAELAVPVRAELVAGVSSFAARLDRCIASATETRAERLRLWSARLPTPVAILGMKTQRLDDIGERLPRALRAAANQWQSRYARAAEPLRAAMRSRIADARHDLAGAATRLRPTLLFSLAQRAAERTASSGRLLESLNPLAILSRGYAVVTRPDGSLVKSAGEARREVRLGLRFGDSRDPVEVAVGAKPRKSASQGDTPLQAKLL
jgi:exodeoxyribonuclease VII large subunit